MHFISYHSYNSVSCITVQYCITRLCTIAHTYVSVSSVTIIAAYLVLQLLLCTILSFTFTLQSSFLQTLKHKKTNERMNKFMVPTSPLPFFVSSLCVILIRLYLYDEALYKEGSLHGKQFTVLTTADSRAKIYIEDPLSAFCCYWL